MVKKLVSLMAAIMPILLLSACGDSGSSNNGAIVTNEVVLAKTGSNYQEVRHIVLRGTNQEIGAAIARLSKEQYQARPFPFPTQQAKQDRNAYIQQKNC